MEARTPEYRRKVETIFERATFVIDSKFSVIKLDYRKLTFFPEPARVLVSRVASREGHGRAGRSARTGSSHRRYAEKTHRTVRLLNVLIYRGERSGGARRRRDG